MLTVMTGQSAATTDIGRTFSAGLRVELAKRRIYISSLAAVLGVSVSTIYRRLAGETDWPLDDAIAIASHLGVSLTHLTSAGKS